MSDSFKRVHKGLTFRPQTTTPANPTQGDLWYDNATNRFIARINTVSDPVITEAASQTLTNKTINAASNTISNIANANISSSAAIAYSKLSLSNSIVNADISSSAAIAYSKLSLSNSIVNADISNSAAIAYSKLALSGSIVNADISSSAAIAYSKLSLSNSIVNADISNSAAIAYSKLNLNGAILNSDLAGSIADNKLANSYLYANGTRALTGALTQTQQTTPANPPAGSNKLYFKSDGNLYKLDSSGTETVFTTGVGGGDVLNGGNSFGSAMTLGTNDNYALNLETNNTARATINSTGEFYVANQLRAGSNSSLVGAQLETYSAASTNTLTQAIYARATNTYDGAVTASQHAFQAQNTRNITTSQTDTSSNVVGYFRHTWSVPSGQTLTSTGSIEALRIAQPVLSGGGSLNFSNFYKIRIESDSLATGTNKYGIYIDSQTGAANNWQIYSAGTAPSYFAGSLRIGTTSTIFSATERLSIYAVHSGTADANDVPLSVHHYISTNTALTGGGSFAAIMRSRRAVTDNVTDVPSDNYYMRGSVVIDNVFTVSSTKTYSVSGWANLLIAHSPAPSGSLAIGSYYGIRINATSINTGTNKYGIYIDSQSGATNNWQIYSAGTAPSYFAGPIRLADGSASAPSFTFNNDPDTGIYRSTSNSIGFASNGIPILQFNESSGDVVIRDLSASTKGFYIQRNVSDGLLSLSSSAGSGSGRNMMLYGDSHPSKAFVFELRRSNIVDFSIDNNGAVTLGSSGGTEAHVINGGFTTTQPIGIAGVTSANYILRIADGSNPLTGVTQGAVSARLETNSNATSAWSFYSGLKAGAGTGPYTLATYTDFYSEIRGKDTNATITRRSVFATNSVPSDAANNCWGTDSYSGFTGNWGIYLGTSNASHFAGALRIGTSTYIIDTGEILSASRANTSGSADAVGITLNHTLTLESAAAASNITGVYGRVRRAVATNATINESTNLFGIRPWIGIDIASGGNYTNTGFVAGIVGPSLNYQGSGTLLLTNYAQFYVRASVVSSITNKYGIYIDSQSGATNNWQIYSAGTAPSYFAGRLLLAGATPSNTNALLAIGDNGEQTLLSNTSQYGILSDFYANTSATSSAAAVYGLIRTNSSGTYNGILTGVLGQTNIRGSAAATRAVNFRSAGFSLSGTLTNSAHFADNTTFTGDWGIHLTTTNPSYFAGPMEWVQISTPANPSAGSNRLYFKSDGNLYKLNSAGTESLIGGAPSYVVTTVTTDTTMSSSTDVLLVNKPSAASITLPAVVSGKRITIKDISGAAQTNNITITRAGAALIDGQVSVVISTNYGSLDMISDGTNWYII